MDLLEIRRSPMKFIRVVWIIRKFEKDSYGFNSDFLAFIQKAK